jgi:predicted GNAT family N-acyltransferase
MDNIIIKTIAFSDPLYGDVFALREKVLRQPLGLSLHEEDTSGDKNETIYIALSEQALIACLMAKEMSKDLLKFRQMAVDSGFQAKGVGRLLVQYAEADARKRAYQKIALHARQNVQAFYERLGYTAYGPAFVEVSIPHIKMEKFL